MGLCDSGSSHAFSALSTRGAKFAAAFLSPAAKTVEKGVLDIGLGVERESAAVVHVCLLVVLSMLELPLHVIHDSVQRSACDRSSPRTYVEPSCNGGLVGLASASALQEGRSQASPTANGASMGSCSSGLRRRMCAIE